METLAAYPAHTLVVCNQLFRNEMSAVESYNQVLERFHGDPSLDELVRIRDGHMRGAGEAMEFIVAGGGRPDSDPGSWGLFAKALQGTANLFGEDSAIAVLRKGEGHGRRLFEKSLADKNLPQECREWIRRIMLARIEHHLAALERMRRH